MSNLSIETAQNVAISNQIASIGERLLARIVDDLIRGAYVFVLFLMWSGISPSTAGVIFSILPILFYNLALEIFLQGQSVGKIILRIRVSRLDGEPVSLSSYLLRWLLGTIDFHLFSGVVAILTILFSGRGQRLGDIAGGTTVVRIHSKVTLADTILAQVPYGYEVLFPQAVNLTDADLNTIREVLKYIRTHHNESSRRVALKAKDAVQRKIGVVSELPPVRFFETLLIDYNCLHASTNQIE